MRTTTLASCATSKATREGPRKRSCAPGRSMRSEQPLAGRPLRDVHGGREDAIEKLDMVLSRYVREAEVYVVDLPGAELVVDGVIRARSSCSTRRHRRGHPARVRIFVYQRNVERASGSVDGWSGARVCARARGHVVFLEAKARQDPAELSG